MMAHTPKVVKAFSIDQAPRERPFPLSARFTIQETHIIRAASFGILRLMTRLSERAARIARA